METDSDLRQKDQPSIMTKHPWRTMLILLVGCFISMVVETMLNVALTTLEQDLGVSTAVIQWVTTGYILVVAIIIPITAFLIHCFTTKQLFAGAMLLMALTKSTLPVVFYIGVCMLMYLGIGFSQAPLQSHIYGQLPDEDRTDAVAMSNVGLQIGGSAGSAISVILFSQFRNIFAASADGIFHSFSVTFFVLGVAFIIPVILVVRLFKR